MLCNSKRTFSLPFSFTLLEMLDVFFFLHFLIYVRGTGPSARSNHVAALYDDKTLLIFGGTSKSRTLNDLYSLDFETVCKYAFHYKVNQVYNSEHHPNITLIVCRTIFVPWADGVVKNKGTGFPSIT